MDDLKLLLVTFLKTVIQLLHVMNYFENCDFKLNTKMLHLKRAAVSHFTSRNCTLIANGVVEGF